MNFAMLKDVEPGESGAAPDAAAPPDEQESHETSSMSEDGGEEGTEFIVTEKKPINKSALTLFVILAIGSAATYVMHLRTGPQSAAAADPVAISAENSISEFMKGGNGNIILLRHLLDGTAKVVEQFKDYTNVAQVPLSELKANPFQSSVAKPQGIDDSAQAARKRKEEEHANIVKAVQGLQLQTVVIRANKKACIINNMMYQEGDTLDKFTLVKIDPNAVIVKSGSYKFELKMASTGGK